MNYAITLQPLKAGAIGNGQNIIMYVIYMSIVTMKNKTKAKQNLSTEEGFSLKGTIRNIRGIGYTQKRSEVRTIFKGTSPTGYGGLPPSRDVKNCVKSTCEDFPLHVLNNTSCINIKSTPTSAMTTKGLISSRIYHPTKSANNYLGNSGCSKEDKCPTWWVKNFNPLARTQSEYIHNIKIRCSVEENEYAEEEHCQDAYFIGTHKFLKSTYYKTSIGAITSGEFTEVNLLRNHCLPTPPCKKPFPFVLNTNGCNREYLTPQQAQYAGLLPEDWMNCRNTKAIYTNNPYS